MLFHDINELYTVAKIDIDVYLPTVATRIACEIKQESSTGGFDLNFTLYKSPITLEIKRGKNILKH